MKTKIELLITDLNNLVKKQHELIGSNGEIGLIDLSKIEKYVKKAYDIGIKENINKL